MGFLVLGNESAWSLSPGLPFVERGREEEEGRRILRGYYAVE
jgi:hypothetical protein